MNFLYKLISTTGVFSFFLTPGWSQTSNEAPKNKSEYTLQSLADFKGLKVIFKDEEIVLKIKKWDGQSDIGKQALQNQAELSYALLLRSDGGEGELTCILRQKRNADNSSAHKAYKETDKPNPNNTITISKTEEWVIEDPKDRNGTSTFKLVSKDQQMQMDCRPSSGVVDENNVLNIKNKAFSIFNLLVSHGAQFMTADGKPFLLYKRLNPTPGDTKPQPAVKTPAPAQ